tara:strand:- start:278 stop:685 length:408 start_codon:yes stop_codon:yes gene_type:complete
MAKVGSFLHQVSSTTDVAAVGTSYNAAKYSSVRLRTTADPTRVGAILSGVYVKVKTIAGGAAKLSIQISTDVNGDSIIIPSSEADLSTGVTTATVGAAVYDLAIDYVSSSDQIYIWYKTDAGTVTVDSVEVSWRE